MSETSNTGLVITPIPEISQEFMAILKEHNIKFTADYIGGNAIVYLDPSNSAESIQKAHMLSSAFDKSSAWIPLPMNFADADLAITAMKKHGLNTVAVRRVWWSRRQKVLVDGERRLVEMFRVVAPHITVEHHGEIVHNFRGVDAVNETEDRDYWD